MHVDRVMTLAKKALASGGRQIGPLSVEWDIAGNCSAPHVVEKWAKPDRAEFVPVRAEWAFGWIRREYRKHNKKRLFERFCTHGFSVVMFTRCRRCDNCRRMKRSEWMARSVVEFDRAKRCWLWTLTIRPSALSMFGLRTAARLAARRVVLEHLSPDEQFREKHADISREIQLMFKRMRSQGAVFRYLQVVEAHKSGLPHYHLMLFESDEPLKKRYLDEQWAFGFSTARLVDDRRGACYAAKYLHKDNCGRVRASIGFGSLAEIPPLASSDNVHLVPS